MCNAAALRALRLPTLNRTRVELLVAEYADSGRVLSVPGAAAAESLLPVPLPWERGFHLNKGRWRSVALGGPLRAAAGGGPQPRRLGGGGDGHKYSLIGNRATLHAVHNPLLPCALP